MQPSCSFVLSPYAPTFFFLGQRANSTLPPLTCDHILTSESIRTPRSRTHLESGADDGQASIVAPPSSTIKHSKKQIHELKRKTTYHKGCHNTASTAIEIVGLLCIFTRNLDRISCTMRRRSQLMLLSFLAVVSARLAR